MEFTLPPIAFTSVILQFVAYTCELRALCTDQAKPWGA